MDRKQPSAPVTSPVELTDKELDAVCGGGHAVTGKINLNASSNANAPGAWADGTPPPKWAR